MSKEKCLLTLLILGVFVVSVSAEIDPAKYIDGYDSDSEAVSALLNDLSQERPSITDNQAIWTQWGLTWLDIHRGQLESAQNKLTQLKAEYADNPELATGLYWLGNAYWIVDNTDKAAELYLYTKSNEPGSDLAFHSDKNLVMMYISQGKLSQAQTAYQNFLSDYADHNELPFSAIRIANEYLWQDHLVEAKAVYEDFLSRWPDDYHAITAEKVLLRFELSKGNYEYVEESVPQFISKYSGHKELPVMIFWLMEDYYTQATKKEDKAEVNMLLQKAIEMGQLRKDTFPNVNCSYTEPRFYSCLGDIYRRLEQYDKAIEYHQKVVNEYPEYEKVWQEHYQIGKCYERMLKKGIITEAEAVPKMKAAYEKLITDYPDCKAIKAAQSWADLD